MLHVQGCAGVARRGASRKANGKAARGRAERVMPPPGSACIVYTALSPPIAQTHQGLRNRAEIEIEYKEGRGVSIVFDVAEEKVDCLQKFCLKKFIHFFCVFGLRICLKILAL